MQQAEKQMAQIGKTYEDCCVGTLVEETGYFYTANKHPSLAQFALISSDHPLPDQDEFLMLAIPRHPWVSGILKLGPKREHARPLFEQALMEAGVTGIKDGK